MPTVTVGGGEFRTSWERNNIYDGCSESSPQGHCIPVFPPIDDDPAVNCAIFGDINGDGFVDIFVGTSLLSGDSDMVSNYAAEAGEDGQSSAETGASNRIYLNKGNAVMTGSPKKLGEFELLSAPVGAEQRITRAAVFGDVSIAGLGPSTSHPMRSLLLIP